MHINNYSGYNYTNSFNYKALSFKSRQHLKIFEKNSKSNFEYGMRILGNKFFDLIQPKSSKFIIKRVAALSPRTDKLYLEELSEIARFYISQKVIDINLEDEILEQLAKKNNSTIFIMNHSNQKEDPQMLAVLNTLLLEAYKKTNRDKFPLPKILLNKDILSTMNPLKRKAFENLGAVGIDASVLDGNKEINAKVLLPLLKDFIQDKCNIFIFPEGRLAVRKDLDIHTRFQEGIAILINKMLGYKKEINVVPIGFAYGKGKQKKLNAINIGTPLVIKRSEEITTITKGDIEKKSNSILYDFFEKHKNLEDIAITSKGKPVEKKEVSKYLKTILCENLEINTEIAENKLKIPLNEAEAEFY